MNFNLPSKKTITTILISAIVMLSCFLVFLLSNQSPDPSHQSGESESLTAQDLSQSQEDLAHADETNRFSEAIANYQSRSQRSIRETADAVHSILMPMLKDRELVDLQPQILQAIATHPQKYTIDEFAPIFLPTHPALVTKTAPSATQLNVPLILQKNPELTQIAYGNTGTRQLGENGCAIAVLAMVQSYLEQKDSDIRALASWAGDTYFTPDGTSWLIFHDFAQAHKYQCTDYGNQLHLALEQIKHGQLIIASVKEGSFTEVGHFMVIRGYDPLNKLIYVNDSNDNPQKLNSFRGIDESIFDAEGVNYWVISK